MLRRALLVLVVAVAPAVGASSCAAPGQCVSLGTCLTGSCGCCSQCLYDLRDPINGTCGCCLDVAAKPFAPGVASASLPAAEHGAVRQARVDGAMPY